MSVHTHTHKHTMKTKPINAHCGIKSESLFLRYVFVFVVRSVLLFRPPRLKNMFEDSMVVFTDYLTIGSLRRFIRDHM